MNTKTSQQLARVLMRLDRQRRRRQALMQQIAACLWWTELRAPRSGGDAA